MSFAALLGRPSHEFCASMRCDALAPSPFVPFDDEEAPRRFPLLGGEPGARMRSIRLVTIVSPGDPLAPTLVSFGARFPSSSVHCALREAYGVAPARPTLSILGELRELATERANEIDEATCARWIERAIVRALDATPDGATIYVAYPPANVSAPSIRLRAWGARGDRWAVVPRDRLASSLRGVIDPRRMQRSIERATAHAVG